MTTYVLYSGKIKDPVTEFTEGINTYRIQPILMRSKDADKLFRELEEKVNKGEAVTKAELFPLCLSPLMGGNSQIKDRVIRSYQILKVSKGVAAEDINKIEAVIYAMADKFLNEMEIEDIQEMMAMTKIGQALVNQGIEKGITDQIRKKLAKGKTVAEIADALEETEEVIKDLMLKYDL